MEQAIRQKIICRVMLALMLLLLGTLGLSVLAFVAMLVMGTNEMFSGTDANGYTVVVWYHNWHGPFIKMADFE